ncbi:SO2930 family diheme c-type cytochrome [Limibacter armeniacum]|uniref:SO2930 family diheme c-type cytochrome n=1 Tax=Limibacter armeniacum TaxID=466084 RepID=UPI002FE5F08A
MRKGLLAVCTVVFFIIVGFSTIPTKSPKYEYSVFDQLSEYHFFEGDLSALKPAKNVIPYSLNTPLFSDYAKKLRFIKLPEGSSVAYNEKEVFDYPIGTVLIKNFYYFHDARKPEKGRRIIETRLLIHAEEGWKALPYVWNDDQTEAYLDVAGATKEVTWRSESGKKMKLNYQVPNANQCKGCHLRGDKLMPIGPSARQLNGEFEYKEGKMNQLEKWSELRLLTGLPASRELIPQLAVWNDPTTGNLDDRARAWLDINCGHCHRPDGPANTSGLFLYIHEKDPTSLGINKSPVAAGKGSGSRPFDIVPGKPNASILLYRMTSLDPGEMMPEIGRTLVHKEGIDLIEHWIASLEN